MGLVVKPNTFSSNTTALASEVNANFDTLYTLVNGNIEEANLANGAVTENKIAAGAVTTAKISATAEIAMSQLAALTASRAAVTDGSGVLSASAVTATELGFLTGVTSAIQTQLDAKVADSDLTAHEGDTTNPHSVTAAQVGAIPAGNISSMYIGWIQYNSDLTDITSSLPSGWTASETANGQFTVTHNLSLTDASDLVIATGSFNTSSINYIVESAGSNSFRLQSYGVDDGLQGDRASFNGPMFIAAKIS